MGIPVQMLNDRNKVNKPFSQIGFIEFMIVPLELAKVKLFPTLFDGADNLQINLQEWYKAWVDDVNPGEEEREKVFARVQKAADQLLDVCLLHFTSEDPTAAEPSGGGGGGRKSFIGGVHV